MGATPNTCLFPRLASRYPALMQLTILVVPPFSTLCNAAFALRREVFVIEQKVPEAEENDAEDLTATHMVAIMQGEVVGTLRLINKPEHVKIGRVAVRQSYRGQGIAKQLMRYAMEHAKAEGRDKFFLTAQSDKLAMYEKMGFAAFGPEFMDAGIPHRAMRSYDRETATLTS